jgi:predicted RND superfamily exporter protein
MTAYIYPRQGEWDRNVTAALKRDAAGMDEGWHLTGWQLLENDLKSSIIKESLTAALLSFLFIITVLFVHFRRLSLIVLVQLPLVSGIVCTLGVMGTAGISFNYINISAIAMIFGISVDYGVYFMQSFLEQRGDRDNPLIKHAFKNIVICSLTTIAGFGSLIFTNFRGISSLGQVIIIGIISCLVMSAVLLPVCDRLLNRCPDYS